VGPLARKRQVAHPAAVIGDGERLAAVAAASRSGASAEQAWGEWDPAGVAVADGVPDLGRSDPLARDARAAARLAHSAGIPLADLVSELARVETVRDGARRALDVALAGPRASARLLGWLPVAGLALGAIVEPRTVVVLATTPMGWALAIIAAALMVAGRRWMGALTRTATEAGRLP
jgi:tight adherence protein B